MVGAESSGGHQGCDTVSSDWEIALEQLMNVDVNVHVKAIDKSIKKAKECFDTYEHFRGVIVTSKSEKVHDMRNWRDELVVHEGAGDHRPHLDDIEGAMAGTGTALVADDFFQRELQRRLYQRGT